MDSTTTPLLHKCNNRKFLLPNVKAVGQTEVELHIFKADKLNACTKCLSANLIT